MSRFNTPTTRPAVTSPVTTTGPTLRTAEGATGYARDTKSELFLLGISNTVGHDAFYEKAGDRDDRFQRLVRTLATTDPAWTSAFLSWLRTDANMRTAALVGAAEFTAERILHQAPGYSRQVINSVLQRPDEPGEFLAYWTSRYGRKLPQPVKRGVADAARRLYSERALLKYDGDSKSYRFADVLELTHPAPHPDKPWQGDLFRHAIDARHNRIELIPDSLPVLQAQRTLAALPVADRRAYVLDPTLVSSEGGLAGAGFTWERLAGWLQGPMDAAAWEAIIPAMGTMALVRNLRNFDQAGVSDKVAAEVCARIADPAEVRRSRQFPFRYLAAYKHAPSLRWGHTLETALGHSLANVPSLPGRTLVLIDRSGSMFDGISQQTKLNRADSAAVFGVALALRAASADLVQFGTSSAAVPFQRGDSVLRLVDRFGSLGGTETAAAVRQHYRGHDRVVIVTDEQAHGGYWGGDPTKEIPETVPLYTWNLAGYRAGHGPSGSGNRHTFGGLTDQAFGLIPLLEAGRSASWPWEHEY